MPPNPSDAEAKVAVSAAAGAGLGKGHLLTLVYVTLTAFSQVFLNHVGTSIPTAVSLFYMALAACVVFNIAERRNLKRNHSLALRHWPSYAVLSLSFVVNWLFSYYSVTHAPAQFFVAVFFLTIALCACVAAHHWLKAACCVAAITADHLLTGTGGFVLATSMAAGVCMYVYYVSSLRFGREAGLGPISVVSMRCYLLLACTAGYLLATGATAQLRVDAASAGNLVVLVLANMVLPSFLSQTCLHWVGPRTFAFINSLIPVVTFVLQSLVIGIWHPAMLLAATLATLVLNYDLLVELLRPAAKAPQGS